MRARLALCCNTSAQLSSPERLPLAAQKLAHSQAALLVVVGASAGRGRGGSAGRGGSGGSHRAGTNPASGAGPGRDTSRPARRGAHGACRERAGGKEGGHPCVAHARPKLVKKRKRNGEGAPRLRNAVTRPAPGAPLPLEVRPAVLSAAGGEAAAQHPCRSLSCSRAACQCGQSLPKPILCQTLQLEACQTQLQECAGAHAQA